MVFDESSPLRVNIFGKAGHVVIWMFAHLIHGVTWKTAAAPSASVGGPNTPDTSQAGAQTAKHF